METTPNHNTLVEDEWYNVRHSGEIPEIALHSSLHYLTEDSDGPKILLTEKERDFLLDAAQARYEEIILRDINSDNRDATSYRGVLRAICNWRRLKRFCQRHNKNADLVKNSVATGLTTFLYREVEEVCQGTRSSSINCTYEELRSFLIEMDLHLADIVEELKTICAIV